MINFNVVCFCFILLVATRSVWSIVTDEQYGRLPPVFELDSFDNCMLLGKESLYCTIEFQLEPIDSQNVTDTWKQIKELSDNPKNYRHDLLRHGICISSTCPNMTRNVEESSKFRNELAKCYNTKYENEGLYGTIKNMHCQTNEPLPYDSFDKTVILSLLVYFLFVLFASIYEGVARYKTKEEYVQKTGTTRGKIISCFSIPNNFYRLKTVDESAENQPLKCIQGIRFFNICLVIMAHTFITASLQPISNTQMTEKFTDQFENIFLVAGTLAVQTFFFTSALLLTYNVFLVFDHKKEFNLKTIVWIFINRYLRLAPLLAVVLALHASVLAHVSNGPFWDHIIGEEFRNCRKNGWTNLLFINNYVNRSEMCAIQTWYIAADSQLFLMALFILALMLKFRENIKWILGICLIIAASIPGIIAFVKNSDSVSRTCPEDLYKFFLKQEEWHDLYASGHSNAAAYIIGIIFGYLYYLYRDVELFKGKIYVVLYYIFSYGMGLAIVATAYPMYLPSYVHSNLISALYWPFGKIIFTLAVATGIFGMTQKVGWFDLWLCRWNPLQALGRLTYSAYLIHLFLIRVRTSFVRYPTFASRYMCVVNSVGDITMAYLFAFFLCLCFEMPMSALQKLWIPQTNKDKNAPKEITLSKVITEKQPDNVETKIAN